VSVSAVGVNVLGAHEDVCNARLEFASGCVATLTVSRLALKTERKLRVFADDAYVTADYGNRNGLVLTAQDNREKLREVAARMAAGEDLTSLDWSNVVTAKPLELVEDCADQDRARRCNGMTQCHCATVDVDFGGVEFQIANELGSDH